MSQLQAPWIRADLSDICHDGHNRALGRLMSLIEGLTQEALACGMKPYYISQALQYVGTELESKRLARQPLARFLPPQDPPDTQQPEDEKETSPRLCEADQAEACQSLIMLDPPVSQPTLRAVSLK